MNVFRLNHDLLTNKIYSNKAAIDSRHTESQVFFGPRSHVIHVKPISKAHPFIQHLQNFVRQWGAPHWLLDNHTNNQARHKIMDYSQLLWIGFWQSEPYYKHQNMFERQYTGTPPELWYLCMQYVSYIFNCVSDPSFDFWQPIFMATTGQVGDISIRIEFGE